MDLSKGLNSIIDRRGLLSMFGGAATAVAVSMMPRIAHAQEIKYSRVVEIDESEDYNLVKLNSVLNSNKTLEELTEDELKEILKLTSSLARKIIGKPVSEQIKQTYKGDTDERIVLKVSRDPSILNDEEVGIFSHEDKGTPSQFFLFGGLKVHQLPSVILHEIMHGAFGPGEIKCELISTLGMLYLQENLKIDNIDQVVNVNGPLQIMSRPDYISLLDASMRAGTTSDSHVIYGLSVIYLIDFLERKSQVVTKGGYKSVVEIFIKTPSVIDEQTQKVLKTSVSTNPTFIVDMTSRFKTYIDKFRSEFKGN